MSALVWLPFLLSVLLLLHLPLRGKECAMGNRFRHMCTSSAAIWSQHFFCSKVITFRAVTWCLGSTPHSETRNIKQWILYSFAREEITPSLFTHNKASQQSFFISRWNWSSTLNTERCFVAACDTFFIMRQLLENGKKPRPVKSGLVFFQSVTCFEITQNGPKKKLRSRTKFKYITT